MLFPHLGDFGGNGGPGKIISPVAGSVGFHDSPLSTRSPYHLYSFPVFSIFAMTTMADSCTLTPVSQVTSIKAGLAHFSLPFERLIF